MVASFPARCCRTLEVNVYFWTIAGHFRFPWYTFPITLRVAEPVWHG
jgi:hypothetical protein